MITVNRALNYCPGVKRFGIRCPTRSRADILSTRLKDVIKGQRHREHQSV